MPRNTYHNYVLFPRRLLLRTVRESTNEKCLSSLNCVVDLCYAALNDIFPVCPIFNRTIYFRNAVNTFSLEYNVLAYLSVGPVLRFRAKTQKLIPTLSLAVFL